MRKAQRRSDRSHGLSLSASRFRFPCLDNPAQRRLCHGPTMADHDHTKPMSWGANRPSCGNEYSGQFRIGDCAQYPPQPNFPEMDARDDPGTGPPRSRSPKPTSGERGSTGTNDAVRFPSPAVATIRHRHRPADGVTDALWTPISIASTGRRHVSLFPLLCARTSLPPGAATRLQTNRHRDSGLMGRQVQSPKIALKCGRGTSFYIDPQSPAAADACASPAGIMSLASQMMPACGPAHSLSPENKHDQIDRPLFKYPSTTGSCRKDRERRQVNQHAAAQIFPSNDQGPALPANCAKPLRDGAEVNPQCENCWYGFSNKTAVSVNIPRVRR